MLQKTVTFVTFVTLECYSLNPYKIRLYSYL
nr:MAG TPA: hypothetical protein [Caudoviricetes sp.]